MWRTAQLIALIRKESIYLQGQLQSLTQHWRWETAFILLTCTPTVRDPGRVADIGD